MSEFNTNIESRVKTLENIVLGNATLNMPSLHERIKTIDHRLDSVHQSVKRIDEARMRERQILYGVAIGLAINGTGLIALFVRLSQLFTP